jgi:hypothetical protein
MKTSRGGCPKFAYGEHMHRFSELQQFRVAHLPQPITQRGNVELFFEPDTLHPRILHQGDRDRIRRNAPGKDCV